MCIVFTFSCRRLTLRVIYVICAAVWVIGITIAIVPTNDLPYFYNEDRQYGFYGIFDFQVKLRPPWFNFPLLSGSFNLMD